MNRKQAQFCEEYAACCCSTKAAIRAGYSQKTAYSIGSALLRKAEIASRVRELMDLRSEATRISANRVVQELAIIAFSNINDYTVDDTGKVELADRAASPDALRAVAKVKRRRVVAGNRVIIEVQIDLWDKNAALMQLGRHLGLFNDKLKLTNNHGLADIVIPINFGT